MNLENPKYYFNRELSWLEFNDRVLDEAFDKSNLLFERLKFLAISSSNLDEFFMVRVSSLFGQIDAGYNKADASGLTPKEQLNLINRRIHTMVDKQFSCLNQSIFPALEKESIFIRQYKDLNKVQKDFVKRYFYSTIYPILTPMAIDQARPFPLLNNKALVFIIELMDEEDKNSEENLIAFMQVPTVIPRIIDLPSSDETKIEYIMVETVIRKFMDELFPGNKVITEALFRINRNSDLDIDEEYALDLLDEIEKSIKQRKWGAPVRLEIEKNMSKYSKKFLQKAMDLKENEIYEIRSILDNTVWFSFINGTHNKFDKLKNEELKPRPNLDFLNKGIFDAIKEKDILVHHPYDSFDCVTKFIKTASKDPQVLAIKQTLYRVSGNSPIVNSLIQAAENGKQVTVLVELKARFDEENNINWAKKLEKSGCHVVYGLVGLKIHCKACLIVRKERDGIHRYVHLATGNYNDSTAKSYTDIGFFTCKETFGQDISALFNLITGYSKIASWNKISVAPIHLRELFLTEIEKEKKNALEGKKSTIIMKMNSLVDTPIIKSLYEASMAGVKIKLIIRGICCLKPGIPGISENIKVVSIVDRYLEHSRIFYFQNGDNPKIYLSSADLMPRNLDRRIEIAFPIDDKILKEKIMEILNITLSDTVKLRTLTEDGSYHKLSKKEKNGIQSQLLFYKNTNERYLKAHKEKKEDLFKPVITKKV